MTLVNMTFLCLAFDVCVVIEVTVSFIFCLLLRENRQTLQFHSSLIMGNAVATLCNLTKAILVVRLSQLYPLYYDYDLEPGKCMERTVGSVWFTIEVATRIFDDGNTTYESLGREAFIHVR